MWKVSHGFSVFPALFWYFFGFFRKYRKKMIDLLALFGYNTAE